MPFTGTFVEIIDGHLIYGWGTHREFFRRKHGAAASKPRYMEDYGINVKSSSDFGAELKSDHAKFSGVVDKPTAAPGWTDDDAAQKCKGGLWWATRNHKYVHFYLGGLDLDMVVGSGQAKSKGITCRELRWVYRFQADANVKEYIQFWRPAGVDTFAGLKGSVIGCGAEKCGAPWDDSVFTDASTKWAAYKPSGAHDINGVHV